MNIQNLDQMLTAWLQEDIGSGDITTLATVPETATAHAIIHAKDTGILAGIDIAAPKGTAIKAAAAGTVVSAGWNNAYGWRIIINHGNGLQTMYAHMKAFAVQEGDSVNAGDTIGYVQTWYGMEPLVSAIDGHLIAVPLAQGAAVAKNEIVALIG